MTKLPGYLCLVLHAHLPFVRHPEHPRFLEENWLFEAISESYLPLLQTLFTLKQDSVPFRLAISITPTLGTMLADPLLQSRYRQYLDLTLELASKEVRRTGFHSRFGPVARYYLQTLENLKSFYHSLQGDLIAAFRQLADSGHLEILASAATHAYLPLLLPDEDAVRAQIEVGVDFHTRFFARKPRGFWLPECAYYPGLDRLLARCGIDYSILDTHGLLGASPSPDLGPYAPVSSPAGISFFARDPDSSRQVWSRHEGYPGDPDYREFYRDIGYDLDLHYLAPYLAGGVRHDTGLKYYRISGKTEQKEPYDRTRALQKANLHASHFVKCRRRQLQNLAESMQRPPVIVAPYDAELFGHWWYEGPQWLGAVLRQFSRLEPELKLATPSELLASMPPDDTVEPAFSSWGHNGYSEVWLNETNDWIYPRLHAAAGDFRRLRSIRSADSLIRRALAQAGRELLLAQSSDWAFMLRAGTTADYAARRVLSHLNRFKYLCKQIRAGQIDETWLAQVEGNDNLFPQLGDLLFI